MFSRARVEVGGFHDVGDVDGAFALDDLALRILLALAHVLFNHARAFNNHALLFGGDADDPATFAFVRAGNDYDFVVFLYMKALHRITINKGPQMTSGARETIFMNFLSRSSRATGPKMRVPRGFSSLSMITMALLSKRRYEPSPRRIGWRVRTTTASTTSPFFTAPSGAASLIWALMMCPTPPYRWLRPMTPMAAARRAPVLSATSKMERICNISHPRLKPPGPLPDFARRSRSGARICSATTAASPGCGRGRRSWPRSSRRARRICCKRSRPS